MKYINSLPGLIFREDFSSRASVYRNGVTPNSDTVEFSDGEVKGILSLKQLTQFWAETLKEVKR